MHPPWYVAHEPHLDRTIYWHFAISDSFIHLLATKAEYTVSKTDIICIENGHIPLGKVSKQLIIKKLIGGFLFVVIED